MGKRVKHFATAMWVAIDVNQMRLKYFRFLYDFAELFKFFGISYTSQSQSSCGSYCTESISPQYHTAQSQSSPCSIILRGVMWHFRILFHSNEIFYVQLFSSVEPAWATDQWVKIFSILDFVELIDFFVKISPQYHTALSQSPAVSFCHRPLKGQCHNN